MNYYHLSFLYSLACSLSNMATDFFHSSILSFCQIYKTFLFFVTDAEAK